MKKLSSTWAAITAITPKIGCNPDTLRNWHQKYKQEQNPVAKQFLTDQQLERENKELQRTYEILHKAATFLAGGSILLTQIMVNFICDHIARYDIKAIYQILPIASST